MGAAAEIQGSRQERKGYFRNQGVMMFVVAPAATYTGLPVPGTTFFTPKEQSIDTTPTGRICTDVTYDWQSVPGLGIVTAQFVGVNAYA